VATTAGSRTPRFEEDVEHDTDVPGSVESTAGRVSGSSRGRGEQRPSSPRMMLIFSSETEDGTLYVRDAQGQRLAQVSSPSTRGQFTVRDLHGHALCRASARWWGMWGWTVTDPSGVPLLSLTENLLTNQAAVHLARGRDLLLRGDPWGHGFTIEDGGGRCVARADGQQAWEWGHHPDEIVVVELPSALYVHEAITIVQIWRRIRQAASTDMG
jgi:hypothetical protein